MRSGADFSFIAEGPPMPIADVPYFEQRTVQQLSRIDGFDGARQTLHQPYQIVEILRVP